MLGEYGIAAVNVWDMEMILGLFSADQKANTPFIIQTTPDQFDPIIPGKIYLNEFEKFILHEIRIVKICCKSKYN